MKHSDFVYFDNAATTKPFISVTEKIAEAMNYNFGNASSGHALGVQAFRTLELARKEAKISISASEGDVFFTSSGTQANNLAILGAALANVRGRHKKAITCSTEHASVLNCFRELQTRDFEIVLLNPDRNGRIDCEQLDKEIDERTFFLSTMFVNNETGAISPVKTFKEIIDRKKKLYGKNIIFHVDAVQAFGKVHIDVTRLGVDLLSVSSHKIHGPKGIGFLYCSENVRIKPLIFGGSQEKSIHPGTEPIPLVVGFEEAIKQFKISQNFEYVTHLKNYFLEKLEKVGGMKLNSPSNSTPYILNFSIEGIKSEVMLNFLSSRKIFVSSASACSKGKRSHVLEAMGLDKSLIESSIRVSFSKFNTVEEIDILFDEIRNARSIILKF
ncbi:MAG: cysteine desulfurase [Oscillospiraceae bacterium]|jgi:cysteine desulfurase|nr:cysteine desulfurase [Oscillospiraceae bacterium]